MHHHHHGTIGNILYFYNLPYSSYPIIYDYLSYILYITKSILAADKRNRSCYGTRRIRTSPSRLHSFPRSEHPTHSPITVVSGPYIIMTLQELERRHLIKHASFCLRIRIRNRNLTLRPDSDNWGIKPRVYRPAFWFTQTPVLQRTLRPGHLLYWMAMTKRAYWSVFLLDFTTVFLFEEVIRSIHPLR